MCGGGGGGGEGTSGGMAGPGTVGAAMGGPEGLGVQGSNNYGGIGFAGQGQGMSPDALAAQQAAMSQMAMSELGNPPAPMGITDAPTVASLFGVQPQTMQEQALSNTMGKGVTGLALGQVAGIPGLSFGLNAAVNAAQQAGQIGSDVGQAASQGAAPGGLGGPGGGGGLLSSVTQGLGYTPMLGQQEQQNIPSLNPARNINMPVGNITSSMLAVPSPKTNISNVMASRGVRAAGTKTALPEWFVKGKRGY